MSGYKLNSTDCPLLLRSVFKYSQMRGGQMDSSELCSCNLRKYVGRLEGKSYFSLHGTDESAVFTLHPSREGLVPTGVI
jgi:hypothetical protein